MIRHAMHYFSFIRRPLLIALVCAAPFFIGGWLVLTQSGGSWASLVPALGGMGLFAVGAIILAPVLATWISESVGSLYTPSGYADYSTPMYGIVDALRVKGDFEGALDYLDQIARAHPRELTPYIKMIDIAALDLHDLQRAEALYRRGTRALRTDGDKAALTVMYQALIARHREPAHRHALHSAPGAHRPHRPPHPGPPPGSH